MVASLSTSPSARRATPQWPWSVYSSRQQIGHQHEPVADLVAQVAQRELHDAVGVPRLGPDRRPCGPARRTGSRRGRRGRRARRPPCAGSRGCAGRRRAATRSAAARRCLRARTAGRPGRRREAGLGRRGGAAPACGATGAVGGRGSAIATILWPRGGPPGPPPGAPSVDLGERVRRTRSAATKSWWADIGPGTATV